jgi:hypothetical protein
VDRRIPGERRKGKLIILYLSVYLYYTYLYIGLTENTPILGDADFLNTVRCCEGKITLYTKHTLSYLKKYKLVYSAP